MNNLLLETLAKKNNNLLTTYFTAGYPKLEDTTTILSTLYKTQTDIIEIGLPYSDPLADGETIQKSSSVALKNGMNIDILFKQLKNIPTKKPLILMGYFNQLLQYGAEKFCKKAQEVGISGIIFPDMPLNQYKKNYQEVFNKYNLIPIFLITPNTPEERIHNIDKASEGFIYAVSSNSTTGSRNEFSQTQIQYFKKLKKLSLKKPIQIGFGISNHQTYTTACNYANGAIIGSAFIKNLEPNNLEKSIHSFINKIHNPME